MSMLYHVHLQVAAQSKKFITTCTHDSQEWKSKQSIPKVIKMILYFKTVYCLLNKVMAMIL